MIINPKETKIPDLHQFIIGAIAPRPIAFVSTMDENGNSNLAPYSFFSAFSSNPPTLVFSSNRRVLGNTTKDTLHNVETNGELVINVVNHAILRQMTIASVEFDSEVNEFEKSGLTPVKSDLIKPFRVKESPVNFECKVKEIVTLGTHGGAGHLIICDVIRIHIKDEVLDKNKRINPHKIDLMGRLGRAYYVRASGNAISTIVQPVRKIVIGYDGLPDYIKESRVLSANNIAQLAGIEKLPNEEEIEEVKSVEGVKNCLALKNPKMALSFLAKKYLDNGDNRSLAIKILMLLK